MGLYSCQGPKGVNGDPYPIKSHILSGFVNEVLSGPRPLNTRMEHHIPLYSVTGGALVKIENSNFQALTNNKGYFTITGIPTGVYNVIVSKDGYGEQKFFGVNIQDDNAVYGGIYGNPYYGLAQKNNIELNKIFIYLDSSMNQTDLVVINAAKNFYKNGENYSSGFPFFMNFKYFFSKDSTVNYNNFLMDEDFNYSHEAIFSPFEYNDGYISDTNTRVRLYNISKLYNYFNSRDTIYMVGYGVNYYKSHGDYFDYDKNKRVYTSLNPKKSNVVSFVLP